MEDRYPEMMPKLPRALLEALAQPFAPQEIQLRPGKRAQDQQSGQWICLAVPFVSRQVCETRLNALVPGNWTTTTPSVVVASHRLVVAIQLQIGPIIHTDYGELLLPPPTEPNDLGEQVRSAPKAFEQAFLGACKRFGLGRSLDGLARAWVPYDRERHAIALSAEERYAHILTLYQQAGLPLSPNARQTLPPEAPLDEQEDRAASLRARDLAWVREQCSGRPLRAILRHYGLSRLEDLTDVQLIEVINRIHQHQRQAS